MSVNAKCPACGKVYSYPTPDVPKVQTYQAEQPKKFRVTCKNPKCGKQFEAKR